MCEESNLAIGGKTVRVTLAGGFPNTFKNEAGEWIGADLSFLALLQRKMRFTAEIKAFATAKQSFGLVCSYCNSIVCPNTSWTLVGSTLMCDLPPSSPLVQPVLPMSHQPEQK